MFLLTTSLSLIVAALNIIFSSIVYFNNPRDNNNRLYAITTISCAGWVLSLLTFNLTPYHWLALLSARFAFFFAATLIGGVWLFSLHFPYKNAIATGKFVRINITIITLIALLTLSPCIVEEVSTKSAQRNMQYGPLYIYFGFYYFAIFFLGIYYLRKKWQKTTGIQRSQIYIMILGLSISGILGLTTNLLYPALTGSSRLSQFGPINTFFFLVATLYSIIRYRFLDIQLIIRRSLIYFFLIVTVISGYSLTIFIIKNQLLDTQNSPDPIDLTAVIFIALTISPLQQIFEKITDNYFFKARYDTQQTVLNLSKTLSFLTSVDQINLQVSSVITQNLKIEGLAIFEPSGHKNSHSQLTTSYNHNLELPYDPLLLEAITNYCHKSSDIFIVEEIQLQLHKHPHWESLIHNLQKHHIAAFLPLTNKKELIGCILLKQKKSGDAFNYQDVELLDIIANSAAVALDNALLYQSLEKRVQQRTLELQRSNKFLLSLQHVTEKTLQNLNSDSIGQSIVDLIHSEMDFLGAFIITIDPHDHSTRLAAISKTPQLEKVLSMLPKPAHDIRGHFGDDEEFNHQVFQKNLFQTNQLQDILSPAIKPDVVKQMQKKLGAKSASVLPIVDQGPYGILVFLSDKPTNQIDQAQKDIMLSLSRMLSLVIRNHRLFQDIQKANQTIQQKAQELEKLNQHLKEIDAAKSEFLSIASHQLRTPLSALRGYISMMAEGDFGAISSKQQSILQKLEDNVQRLSILVNDLLNLARIEAGTARDLNLMDFDLVELINRIIDEVHFKADNQGIKLIFDPPQETFPVRLDREKMEQITMNLLDNAVHYTPQGSITIKIQEMPQQIILISIADTGIGMDPESKEKMFTKFFRSPQAKAQRPDGTGVGLYVVKSMVEQHQGTIWLESTLNQGTTFFLKIKRFL